MANRRFCFLLAALPLIAATVVRADDLLQPKPVQKNKIAITLPKEWTLQPRESAHILVAAASPITDSDTTGDYAAGVTITIAAGSSVDGSAQQDQLSHEIPNYQVTEKPTAITISGMAATVFGGTFTKGSLKLRSRQYLLTHGDHIYTLTITALASAWEQHLPAAEASVATFSIEKN